ncbi:hypothetical protein, partial [Brucella neotomae]|uniref:hypothetical protein n=1 Tax=Brucella neotomae TaxID=29460 RepID=UPI001AEC211A
SRFDASDNAKNKEREWFRFSRTALMAIRHRSQPTRSKQGYALEKVLNGCPAVFKERHANV